jgi:hypothetical protein
MIFWKPTFNQRPKIHLSKFQKAMHFIGCQNVGTFFAKKYQAMGTGQEHGSTQFDLSPSPFMLKRAP